MGGVVGEESRQSKGLVCGHCGVKGAGLANEFIDLPGKAKGGALLQGAIAEKPRFSPPPKGGRIRNVLKSNQIFICFRLRRYFRGGFSRS